MRIELDEDQSSWTSVSEEMDVYGVEVMSYTEYKPNAWQVVVSAMEFVREDPLEAEIRGALAEALRRVPGVSEVIEEDREVWVVVGPTSGQPIAQVAADLIESFGPRITDFIDER